MTIFRLIPTPRESIGMANAHHRVDFHAHGGRAHAPPKDLAFAFGVGTALNLVFVIVEAVCGALGNSVALIADAGHNLSDVLGLLIAWGASVLARRRPTARYTYGLRGSSILAALFNAIFLLIAVGGIAWESIRRFADPQAVAGGTVIIVAAIGIVVNGVTAWLFMSGRKSDLNIRGAFLHMLADAAVSAGVVTAGVAILFTGWHWLDPLASLVIAALITCGTWGLLRDSMNLALHAVPENIQPNEVSDFLKALDGVRDIHDLHIWAMSTTETALTCHFAMPAYPGEDFLKRVQEDLHHRFGIGHATLQVETGEACALAPAHVV